MKIFGPAIRIRFLGAAFLIFLLPLKEVWAWGPAGHRIVGNLADGHLSTAVRIKIRENFNIKTLADVSNWADRVKDARSQRPWHYTNILESEWTYDRRRDCPGDECVVEKIRFFGEELKKPKLSRKKRGEALKYLVHFIADVHQPLHLGNRRDRGGNRIRLFFRGQPTNLHSLWDGGLLQLKGKNLVQYARDLDRRIAPEDIRAWTQSTVTDWANESRKLALGHAYEAGWTPNGGLNKEYIRKSREIMDERLSRAGIRLAQWINKLLTLH
ncbi:MAG: S1/P1 nuclease [Nitrospinaceae bacterium]